MVDTKRFVRLIWLVLPLWWTGWANHAALAHEIVGEVTPVMVHLKRALSLAEQSRHDDALREIERVYEDFSHRMEMGMRMEGTGIRNLAKQVDLRFGTHVAATFEQIIREQDGSRIREAVEQLALLLMLEKFAVLEDTFPPDRQAGARPTAALASQRTIYWLGRNYFSYLLEPSLARTDPVEEKRLDRLLDAMLYRLEDGEYEAFARLRQEVVEGIIQHFGLQLEGLRSAGARP